MKKILKNPFVWATIVGCLLLTVYPFIARSFMRAPPPLLTVGEWSLIGDQGQVFGSKELNGKVVVMDFFFTSCPSLCPEMTRRMKALHEQFGKYRDKVHFVSVSVDPDTDTPQVLRTYKASYGIEGADWTFLTGPKKDIYRLVEEQLKLHVGEKRIVKTDHGEEEVYDIDHVTQFILLDQKGDLRGLFQTDPTNLAALERAAKFVADTE